MSLRDSEWVRTDEVVIVLSARSMTGDVYEQYLLLEAKQREVLEAPVQDQTGLKGKYDLVLDFTKYIPMEERAMKPEFTGIIFAAMQGELGLKLQSEKVTVDVMVVDHVEKPSEN